MNFTVSFRGGPIIGAIANEDMYEGRAVTLCAHTFDYDFGSKTDLPGCKYPSAISTNDRWIVAMAEDNRPTPLYVPTPSMEYALRGGFDQAENSPFAATVYTTHPQNLESQVVIPSGSMVKLYGPGNILQVPSGAYTYSANLRTPGAPMSSTNSTGKLVYSTTNVVAQVVSFDATDASLTFMVVG